MSDHKDPRPIKIGQILLDQELITDEALAETLTAQSVLGGKVGSLLIEAGHLKPDALASCLAEQMNIPVVSGSQFDDISEETLSVFPSRVALGWDMLPLKMTDDQLDVAVLDPTDSKKLDRIKRYVGRTLNVYVATQFEIRFYIDLYYPTRFEPRFGYQMKQLQARSDIQGENPNLLLRRYLSRQISDEDVLPWMKENMVTLNQIPTKTEDFSAAQLTPEISLIALKINGLFTIEDVLESCHPFRWLTLKALIWLHQNKRVSFDVL